MNNFILRRKRQVSLAMDLTHLLYRWVKPNSQFSYMKLMKKMQIGQSDHHFGTPDILEGQTACGQIKWQLKLPILELFVGPDILDGQTKLLVFRSKANLNC